jgi:hypothetical protein
MVCSSRHELHRKVSALKMVAIWRSVEFLRPPELERRDARVHYRRRCATIEEELRPGVDADLPLPRLPGEAQGSDYRSKGDARRRLHRTRCSAVDACAKASGAFTPHRRGCGRGYCNKDFVYLACELNVISFVLSRTTRAPQQHGAQSDTAAWLRRKPEPTLAGREVLHMA